MSKSSKRSKRSRRSRGPVDRSATTDIVTQLEVASKNLHAAAIGAVLGGLVPWFGRTLAHGQIQDTWASNRSLALGPAQAPMNLVRWPRAALEDVSDAVIVSEKFLA